LRQRGQKDRRAGKVDKKRGAGKVDKKRARRGSGVPGKLVIQANLKILKLIPFSYPYDLGTLEFQPKVLELYVTRANVGV
jgi:hypothetical protein